MLGEKDIPDNTKDPEYIPQGVIDEDDPEGPSDGDHYTRDINKQGQRASGYDPHEDHSEGHEHTNNRRKIHTNPLLRTIWDTAPRKARGVPRGSTINYAFVFNKIEVIWY
jgi:hypothetical protein